MNEKLSTVISILNRIDVSGENNLNYLLASIQILKQVLQDNGEKNQADSANNE